MNRISKKMVKMTISRRVKPLMVLSKKNEKGRRGRRRSLLSKRRTWNCNRNKLQEINSHLEITYQSMICMQIQTRVKTRVFLITRLEDTILSILARP